VETRLPTVWAGIIPALFYGLQEFHWVAVADFFRNPFLFIDTFLCSPKEKYPKERAPCVPLDPALLKTGGPFKNSAPKKRGPQTA
jgi:hypothetical protein